MQDQLRAFLAGAKKTASNLFAKAQPIIQNAPYAQKLQQVVQPVAQFYQQDNAQRSAQVQQYLDRALPKPSLLNPQAAVFNPIARFAGDALFANQISPQQLNDPKTSLDLAISLTTPMKVGGKLAGLKATTGANSQGGVVKAATADDLIGLPQFSELPKKVQAKALATYRGVKPPQGAPAVPVSKQIPEFATPKTGAGMLQTRLDSARPLPSAAGQTILKTKASDDIIRSAPIDVKQKVNLLDKLRTPDRVLTKIGLADEAKLIRTKYDDYLAELPSEINRITDWYKQVPQSGQRIFKYLDGQLVDLAPQEIKVAAEIQDYLKGWADRLKLPQEKRITNYITHIFDEDLIKKEFDPELAKLIDSRIAGSVYDPFVEKRLGALGYKEDVWQALDAYVKRGVRKVHMDEALKQTATKAESLELSQFKYVKNYVDRVNLRPTDWDNMLDNLIKSTPIGYKLGVRPTAVISRGIRQAIYRGTLGLNPGSALKNLSQAANTYSKLGERYTVEGYTKVLTNIGSDELERVGVLRDDFIQDRTLNATKKFWQKIDAGLFYMFEAAEKINRGAAYYGAKAKALGQGLDEPQAIEYAKSIVRDTQFTFGSVDTPPDLQSDLVKFLTIFQSYSLKQGEFLAELVQKKEFAGLFRYALASLGFVFTVGKALGMEPKDIIPSFRLGGNPVFALAGDVKDAVTGARDKFGNEVPLGKRVKEIGRDLVPFVPAGTQIRKTVGALSELGKGYSETEKGRVRYPITQDAGNYLKGTLFGARNLPEAREFRKSGESVLGEKQSEELKQAEDKQAVYDQVLDERRLKQEIDAVKAEIEAQGAGKKIVGDRLIYWDTKQDKVRTKTLKTVKEIDGKVTPASKKSGSSKSSRSTRPRVKAARKSGVAKIKSLAFSIKLPKAPAVKPFAFKKSQLKLAKLKSQTSPLKVIS